MILFDEDDLGECYSKEVICIIQIVSTSLYRVSQKKRNGGFSVQYELKVLNIVYIIR